MVRSYRVRDVNVNLFVHVMNTFNSLLPLQKIVCARMLVMFAQFRHRAWSKASPRTQDRRRSAISSGIAGFPLATSCYQVLVIGSDRRLTGAIGFGPLPICPGLAVPVTIPVSLKTPTHNPEQQFRDSTPVGI